MYLKHVGDSLRIKVAVDVLPAEPPLEVKDEVLILGRDVTHDLVQIHGGAIAGHLERAGRKRTVLGDWDVRC